MRPPPNGSLWHRCSFDATGLCGIGRISAIHLRDSAAKSAQPQVRPNRVTEGTTGTEGTVRKGRLEPLQTDGAGLATGHCHGARPHNGNNSAKRCSCVPADPQGWCSAAKAALKTPNVLSTSSSLSRDILRSAAG